MSRHGTYGNSVHPRLTVVPAISGRPAVHDLDPEARVVDAAQLDQRAAEVSIARSDAERAGIDALEAERRTLEGRRSAAELVLHDLIDERSRIEEAAEWCEHQPSAHAEDQERIVSTTRALDDHGRAVREANRQLERVLEQRAAAEAALEEARRELDGLGAAGFDETAVRRQLEEASREVQHAGTAYQELMKDLARRQAEVRRVEAAMGPVGGTGQAQSTHADQLSAMRAAVSAKFAAPDSPGAATESDLAAARAAERTAEVDAENAAFRLSKARQRLQSLEKELSVRIDDKDSMPSRHAAAVELEEQVSSVERRLGEAEASAREVVEDATRSMSRAELGLERLRQDGRARLRRLEGFVEVLGDDVRAAVGDDPVGHAPVLAAALRDQAESMRADVEHAEMAIDRARVALDQNDHRLASARARLDVVLPEDRQQALHSLVGDGAAPVVLDCTDATGTDGVSVPDLEAIDLPAPLVVLTDDPAVVGWAIELPRERGCVTSAAALSADSRHRSDPLERRPC